MVVLVPCFKIAMKCMKSARSLGSCMSIQKIYIIFASSLCVLQNVPLFLHSNIIRPRLCTKQQKYQLFVCKKTSYALPEVIFFTSSQIEPKLQRASCRWCNIPPTPCLLVDHHDKTLKLRSFSLRALSIRPKVTFPLKSARK